MISWLKRLFIKKQFGTGGLNDPPDVRDYHYLELYGLPDTSAINWQIKDPSTWRRFPPIRNQNSSSACVAFATALTLGVENYLEENKFVVLSPRTIYGRGYQPNGGMIYRDGLSIGNSVGSCPDQLLPSDNKSEEGMRILTDEKESDRFCSKIYRGGAFVALPLDLNAIASIVSTGRVVLIGVRFDQGGANNGIWQLNPNGMYGHAMVCTDFTLFEGKLALVVQNSWDESWGQFGGMGIITQDQMSGVVAAWYYETLRLEDAITTKPKLKLTTITQLKLGLKNSEIMILQWMLQFLKLFPATQTLTGYFGGITRQGILDFQKANNLTISGVVDQPTYDTLNSLFK